MGQDWGSDAAAAAATTGFTSAAGQASQFASGNYRCVIVLLALMARSLSLIHI